MPRVEGAPDFFNFEVGKQDDSNGTYTYKAIAFWDELPDVQAQNGYDLGELDGITVTSKNSTS